MLRLSQFEFRPSCVRKTFVKPGSCKIGNYHRELALNANALLIHRPPRKGSLRCDYASRGFDTFQVLIRCKSPETTRKDGFLVTPCDGNEEGRGIRRALGRDRCHFFTGARQPAMNRRRIRDTLLTVQFSIHGLFRCCMMILTPFIDTSKRHLKYFPWLPSTRLVSSVTLWCQICRRKD